jgi:hypothetical protein
VATQEADLPAPGTEAHLAINPGAAVELDC